MLRVACAFVLVFWAGVAQAADKPLFGPAPEWVKPGKVTQTTASQDSNASVQRLLFDIQVNYEADGTEIYHEFPVRFGTPAGLSAANIALDWQPDIETLTIHYVHIIRDGHVIDVLANGQTFTVLRRETDLERAMHERRSSDRQSSTRVGLSGRRHAGLRLYDQKYRSGSCRAMRRVRHWPPTRHRHRPSSHTGALAEFEAHAMAGRLGAARGQTD